MSDTAFVLRRFRRGAAPEEGRFEYRVWPASPHPAVSLLHRYWPLADAGRRSDIYFVHPASDRTLVKLRGGGRLEIKRRARDVGTIQHWTMPVSAEFPLTSDGRGDLALALSLRAGLPPDAVQSPAHLVAALDASGETVVTLAVQKSRLVFRAGRCRAEVCRVAIGGWRGLTIALDSTDLPSIAAALDDLQLGSLPNRSYGEALVRLVSLQSRRRGLPAPAVHEDGRTR